MSTLPPGHRLIDVVPLGGAPGTYTYAVPPALADAAVAGRRVIVPFGTRRRAGIVLGPADRVPDGTLKLIEDVLDDGPWVNAEALALARWAADYYRAPLSLALRAALPPQSEADELRRPVLSDAGRRALETGTVDRTTRQALLAVEAGESQVLAASRLKRLITEGLVELDVEVRTTGVPMIDVAILAAPPDTPVPARNRVQRAVWDLLAGAERASVESLQAAVPGARDALKRLEQKGLVRIEQVPRERAPGIAIGATETPPALTSQQADVLTQLVEALNDPQPKPYLLEGVTGSGKTEVYLRLIARAQETGGRALVLVPEIALTPQLSGRFRARFGTSVAVLHSGLTDRDRAAEWHRVRRGEAQIVVGARSAVFAPMDKPRVIIVDEEHDPSFKQAEGLRYQGRDLAVVRGRLSGALVVLGSATPSLETLLNAQRGRYGHVRLTQRVDTRPLPTVEVVDLRGRQKERIDTGVAPSGLISPTLIDAMRETVERGEQVIVFLNRRGHSTVLLCRDCGEAQRCADCSVALTWHDRRRQLVCHYCGAKRRAPEVCPTCQSTRLLFSGAGTEKLEEELSTALPGARVARLDRDTASTAKKLETLLSRFSRGDIDVLLGTQMVAKGHDFPGVTLVGVLLADAGLHQPDFRAAERTAQLLTQVAGRAGRGQKPGRVLVQTLAPEAPAVAAVRTHDYATFAQGELIEREDAEYPPYRRLCLVRTDAEREEDARRVATDWATRLMRHASPDLVVLGPAPASLERLRGRYRFQVLLKSNGIGPIRAALDKAAAEKRFAPAGVRVTIDVDPVDML